MLIASDYGTEVCVYVTHDGADKSKENADDGRDEEHEEKITKRDK